MEGVANAARSEVPGVRDVMMPAPLVIPRRLAQTLFHHAQLQPALEICGLIGGRDGEPVSCYPVANVSRHPERLFDLEPTGQVAAMKQMRERGETLFAVYHSHPAAPPIPSRDDLAQFSYPDAYYFIVSLNIKGVLEMRAWRMTPGTPVEVPLRIIRD